MGLSVGDVARYASVDLLDWMDAGAGAMKAGENAKPAHIVTSGDATAPSLPFPAPSLKASGGLDPLAMLFASEAGLSAPAAPTMLSSFDDLPAGVGVCEAPAHAPALWAPASAVAALLPPLPPAIDAAAAKHRRAASPAATGTPPPPRTPRVAVPPAAAAALATAAATAALTGGPPPALPPLKRGKRKAVALDDISDLQERRRQRRLAKNRATAAVSRERKHAQMQALTTTVYELQVRNAELVAALEAKDAELAALRAAALGGGAVPATPAVLPAVTAPARATRRSGRARGGEALASIDE